MARVERILFEAELDAGGAIVGFKRLRGEMDQTAAAASRTSTQGNDLAASLGIISPRLAGLATGFGAVTVAAGALAAAGAGALAFLQSSTVEFMRGEAAAARLSAVYKATGGVVGQSVGELRDLSGEMQRLTGTSDEVVQQAEAILLTFRAIRGDAFERTMWAAADLSAVLGQDLNGAVIMLGKALEDPITGLTALRRVGVSFSEAQQDVIKSLVESGRLEGAQVEILRGVEIQVKDTARAMGETLEGSLKRTAGAWSDLKEVIGGSFVNLTGAATGARALAESVEKLTTWLERLKDVAPDSDTAANLRALLLFFRTATPVGPLLGGIESLRPSPLAAQTVNYQSLISGPGQGLDLGIRISKKDAEELNAWLKKDAEEYRKLVDANKVGLSAFQAWNSELKRGTEWIEQTYFGLNEMSRQLYMQIGTLEARTRAQEAASTALDQFRDKVLAMGGVQPDPVIIAATVQMAADAEVEVERIRSFLSAIEARFKLVWTREEWDAFQASISPLLDKLFPSGQLDSYPVYPFTIQTQTDNLDGQGLLSWMDAELYDRHVGLFVDNYIDRPTLNAESVWLSETWDTDFHAYLWADFQLPSGFDQTVTRDLGLFTAWDMDRSATLAAAREGYSAVQTAADIAQFNLWLGERIADLRVSSTITDLQRSDVAAFAAMPAADTRSLTAAMSITEIGDWTRFDAATAAATEPIAAQVQAGLDASPEYTSFVDLAASLGANPTIAATIAAAVSLTKDGVPWTPAMLDDAVPQWRDVALRLIEDPTLTWEQTRQQLQGWFATNLPKHEVDVDAAVREAQLAQARSTFVGYWLNAQADINNAIWGGVAGGITAVLLGESFGEGWSQAWTQLARAAGDLLSGALKQVVIGGAGPLGSSFQGLLSGLMDMVTGGEGGSLLGAWKNMGTASKLGTVAGMGLWTAGAARGNRGMGAAGGALSGMLTGAAWGSGGGWNWPGAIVGAIIGGLVGYFSSGGPEKERATFGASFGRGGQGGWVTEVTGMDPAREQQYARELNEKYRSTAMSFRDLLTVMEQPLGAVPTIWLNVNKETRDVAGLMESFLKETLPKAVFAAYKPALQVGLEALGATTARAAQELGRFDTTNFDQAMERLRAWVGALVAVNESLDELSKDRATVMAELGATSRGQFMADFDEVYDRITEVSSRLEDMLSEEQVSAAQQILELTDQQYQATLDYLAQIQDAQRDIARTYEQTLTGFGETRAREAGTPELMQFYQARITELMPQLAGARSYEDVSRIFGEITGWSEKLFDLAGTLEGADALIGEQTRATVEQYLAQAKAAADIVLAQLEDEAFQVRDQLRSQIELAKDALTALGQISATTASTTSDLGDAAAETASALDEATTALEGFTATLTTVNQQLAETGYSAASLAAAMSTIAGNVGINVSADPGLRVTQTSGPADLVRLINRGALPAPGLG